MPYSDLEDIERIDSQYFRKEAVGVEKELTAMNSFRRFKEVRTSCVRGSQPEYDDHGLTVVNSKHVKNYSVNLFSDNRMAISGKNSGLISNGDILINGTGDGTIGRVSLFLGSENCIPDNHVTVVKTSEEKRAFLFAFLNSRYGQVQLNRHIRGSSGQIELYPKDIDKILVWTPPNGSAVFSKIVGEAFLLLEFGRTKLEDATASLLSALGIADWKPPEPLTYTVSSADAFASGRLDAQFFAPRIQQLIDHLSGAGDTVGSLAIPRREKFHASKHGDLDYIEIGDLDGTGTTASRRVAADEAPSRATSFVRTGDIITSTVRPIRRLSAQIGPAQDGYVCSSGFVVLNPTDVKPELLLTYLRLPVICELMDLFASASMYPAISEADILALPFPAVEDATEEAVVAAVQEGRAARTNARALLDAAKRAVEIAIEDSEEAALTYLKNAGGI